MHDGNSWIHRGLLLPHVPPHCASNPCEQFLGAERLRNIVVGSQFEEQYFIVNVSIGAQYHNWYGGHFSFNEPTQLFSGQPGELQIEDHYIGYLLSETFKALQTI